MLDTLKIYKSNSFGKFKILEYINAKNVVIEFIDTGFITTTRASHIKSGVVRDKLKPSVYSVGFTGIGKYKPRINGILTKQYITWQSMRRRCYSPESLRRYPTYIGCTVCAKWHDFQVFATWFDANYINGCHLDKDIKINGNKVYSPDNCVFVSQAENNIKANAKYYTMFSPNSEVVNIYNMTEFCRDNNLNCGNMVQVSLGKLNQHKGWRKL